MFLTSAPKWVPIGIGPVMTFPVTIRSSTADLTTVTGVSFQVQRPDQTTTTWPGTIQGGATSVQLVAVHAFATSDCTMTGDFMVTPVLSVPGGVVNVEPVVLQCRNVFGN